MNQKISLDLKEGASPAAATNLQIFEDYKADDTTVFKYKYGGGGSSKKLINYKDLQ